MSSVKEPAFFSRAHVREDIRRTMPYLQGEAGYLRLFDDAGAAHRIVGESSTCYMRNEQDLLALKAFAGEPRLLAMVRDPVRLVSSYFHFLRYQGWEPAQTLEEAWALQDERCAGTIHSATANRPDSLAYRNVAMMGEQVARLHRLFGRDNVHVLTVNELNSDPPQVQRRIEAFLGISAQPGIEIPRSNTARRAKVAALDDLVKQSPPLVTRAKNALKRALGTNSLGVRRLIERFNSASIEHSVSPALEREMRACFAPDVEWLGREIGRDLLVEWGWRDADRAACSEASN